MPTTDIKSLHNLPKNTYLNYIKLFPVTQTAKIKTYTTLILTLVAVMAFSLFAISPTVTTIVELRRQLADSEQANIALEDKISALDTLYREYDGMGATLTSINDALPTEPEVPLLFARIQTLASNAQVEVTKLESLEVSLSKKSTTTIPSSFVFIIGTSGTYDQTKQFLNSLRDFNRIVTLDSVTITNDTQSGKPLEASIRARAYFHPEKL